MINHKAMYRRFQKFNGMRVLALVLLTGLTACDSSAASTQIPQVVTLVIPNAARTVATGTVTIAPPTVNTPPLILPTLIVATSCPLPTQQNLQIEPIQSPTSALTQQVHLTVGNLDSVTISSTAGTFQFNQPPYIVPLTPNMINVLTVSVLIKRVVVNGCTYGGYSLVYTLTIVQQSAPPTSVIPDSSVF